jgi:hypothetical protein
MHDAGNIDDGHKIDKKNEFCVDKLGYPMVTLVN